MKLYFTVFFFLLLTCCLPLSGVTQTTGSWTILYGKWQVSEGWSFFGEAQLRSLGTYRDFHYYEIKAGGTVSLTPGIKAALGAGKYTTYPPGGNFAGSAASDEIRLWPQISLQQPAGVVTIENRYRAEFRFSDSGTAYRFRYRPGLSVGLNDLFPALPDARFTVSTEIFFTDKEPYFQRNRFLAAINWQVTPGTRIQTGYIHQFDYKVNDETGKDFLVLGLFVDFGSGTRPTAARDNTEDE